MLTKTELTALWKSHAFRPIKRLGQNFLVDKNIKEKIVQSLALGSADTVIEIGAGFGEITSDLSERAERVFAVEKDLKICEILKTEALLEENVTLVEKDFLDLDIAKILKNGKAIIYGNIPYYVTSPIIEKIFENVEFIKCAYLVIQKEVAERILAKPGSKKRGRLSLYVEYHADAKRIFNITRNSFYPAPLVESALIKFDILGKKRVDAKNEKALFGLIKKAFSQKRKTILNSISGSGLVKKALSEVLKSAGLEPMSRPEELTLVDFARLSNLL